MFDGFTLSYVDAGEATIRVRHGGSGPPLLLLHGHPQTHVMWHLIAPRLAREFSVVAMDLRGYGDSSKPPTTEDHEPYSKRAMGRDAIALMRHFGFERFDLAGHERGGRVSYRLALDHPEVIRRVSILDIVPTGEVWARADRRFAIGYWHWSFLAQAHPFPETLIGQDPETFFFRPPFRAILTSKEEFEDYRAAVHDPAAVHAMCEDYRAGATYDRLLDEKDRGKKKISRPVQVLWGAKGAVGSWYDVLDVWRSWADDLRGEAIDCGHFIPEEKLAE